MKGDAKEKDEDAVKAKALDILNDVLLLKLITVFTAVIDAAKIAGNWIIIDRINAKSPAAEWLIEAAKTKTTMDPEIFVIDSLKRLRNFTSPEARECEKVLDLIKEKGDSCPSINQFYDVNAFKDPRQFYDVDDAGKITAKPLPRAPEPLHLGPDGELDAQAQWRNLWTYHYLQTFFAAGTKYFVLADDNDAPDLSVLGPGGFVCANGQGIMAPRLCSNIKNGKSIVMLHNTGGVTQAWTSLCNAMTSTIPAPSAQELLEKIDIVSPQPWAKEFGLPEVLMLEELHGRAPMLLHTSVRNVNLIEDNVERVLETLVVCFSGGGGVPELGLGEAESVCILTAWKRHMTLIINAEKYERTADSLQMLLYFLGVFTTVLAVLASTGKGDEILADLGLPNSLPAAKGAGAPAPAGNATAAPAAAAPAASTDPFADWTILSTCILFLPLITGLVATLRGRLRPREKWATCLMASQQVVQQIYSYRLRTGLYDVYKPPPPDPETGEIKIKPVKVRETEARKAFVTTVNAIYSKAVHEEVAKGGALFVPNNIKRYNGEDKSVRTKFEETLSLHVATKLHASAKDKSGVRDKRGLKKEREKQLEAKLREKAKEKGKEAAKGAIAAQMKKQGGMFGPLGKLLGKNNKVAAMVDQQIDSQIDSQLDSAMPAPAADAANDGGNEGEESGPPDLIDNLVSQMTQEQYMSCRVRPVSSWFEKRATLMAKRSQQLETFGLLLNSGGAVLAIMEYGDYISITVSLASTCLALTDYFYVPNQITATNKAVQDCHNLISWWDSLSLVQIKRSATTKKLVETLEGAILDVVQSRTMVSPKLPGQGEEGEDAA